MKKTYNAPEINVIRIDNAIMQTNMSGGDAGENGQHAQSRHNSVDFTEEDDYEW